MVEIVPDQDVFFKQESALLIVRRDEQPVDKKKGYSERGLLLSLAASDIELARAFAEGARSAYRSGKLVEGEFARFRSVKFYREVLRSLLQMTEPDRKAFSSDLQNLRIQIEWLSTQTIAPRLTLVPQEDASLDSLSEFLEEKG